MILRNSPPIPVGLLAGVALTVAAVATAHAQTSLQAKLAARPVTRGEITAYKLPATTQVSPGLTTVAIGEPLYLEVQINSAIPAADITGVTWTLTLKPASSKAVLGNSPLGKDVPVYEQSDRLVAQVAGRTLLRPDVTGEYVVSATVTTATNGSANLAQTFIAANYVGISECTRCHSGGLAQNMETSWAKTAHASIFTQGVNGVLGHYSASCLACHTLGNDATAGAVNGGFDDVAAQLKWVFPAEQKAGTWDTVPDALKNLANIQCENCHGPGSIHASSGGAQVAISVSYASGDCSQCHDAPTHHIKSAEWNNSRHAVVTRDPSGQGREGCVGCHTGQGFVGRVQGAKTLNTDYYPINCQACHEPHGQTTPDNTAHVVRLASVKLADGTEVKDAGLGALCMNCHQSRQNASVYAASAAASARFGPHHGPQGDMLEGVNGFTYGQDIPSSAHRDVVEDTCITCHMQTVAETNPAFTHAGGHTFKPSWTPDGATASQDLVGACQSCHGHTIDSFNFRLMDYDEDGKIDGVQTEVQHLLDQVSALLPPVGQSKSALTIDSTWTRAQLEAAYNWQFVKEDGSFGIHNTAYAVGLLKASLADLTKK